MGNARARGSYAERKTAAIAAGRVKAEATPSDLRPILDPLELRLLNTAVLQAALRRRGRAIVQRPKESPKS